MSARQVAFKWFMPTYRLQFSVLLTSPKQLCHTLSASRYIDFGEQATFDPACCDSAIKSTSSERDDNGRKVISPVQRKYTKASQLLCS